MAGRAINLSKGDRIFNIFNIILMSIIMIVTLYPFLNVLAISLNDSVDTVRGGITIWPRMFTWKNYATIFSYTTLIQGLKISIFRTLAGTILGLISSSMLAYTLSRPDFKSRKFVSTFLALTMYVSGGLVPTYMLMRHLELIGTFWIYILPLAVSAFNVFIIRSFIDGLPYALQESAKIDGANDFKIYYKIILPLCKPVMATIALFLAVNQWNSWFDTYLYNGNKPLLTTLQFELMKILQSTNQGGKMANANDLANQMAQVSPESIKMAITIVVTVPILLVYPFLQRYFVAGMTLGAVKS